MSNRIIAPSAPPHRIIAPSAPSPLRFAAPLCVLLCVACTPAAPPEPRFTRSCRGEYVDECRPYTYSRVTSGALEPSLIPIGDPTARAHVTAMVETCGAMTPQPPRVQISALLGNLDADAPDGGGGRVLPLATVGPADASGAIDVMIDNPFFADVPEDTDITLQLAPVIDGCQGDPLLITYRTGFMRTP